MKVIPTDITGSTFISVQISSYSVSYTLARSQLSFRQCHVYAFLFICLSIRFLKHVKEGAFLSSPREDSIFGLLGM